MCDICAICGNQGWTVRAKDFNCLEQLPIQDVKRVIRDVLHGCRSIVRPS